MGVGMDNKMDKYDQIWTIVVSCCIIVVSSWMAILGCSSPWMSLVNRIALMSFGRLQCRIGQVFLRKVPGNFHVAENAFNDYSFLKKDLMIDDILS